MPLLIRHLYQFGQFTIDIDQRVLLREGKPLSVTPKVYDTLLVLVQNNGRIVEKEELMSQLWPDTFVEEANLTFNIKQLRKSLGDDARNPVYIETVARRGYRFIAEVEEVLSDRSEVASQISQRIETFNAGAPSRDTGGEIDTPARAIDASVEVGGETYGTASSTSLDSRRSPAASAGLNRKYVVLGAALMMALAGLGLVLWQLSLRSEVNSTTDGESSPVWPLKVEKLTGTGQSASVAVSPDGKFLAYTQTIRNESGIWLRELATNVNVEIVPATGPVQGLAFANSGEYLYLFKGAPAALYRVSLHGGVPTKIVADLTSKFAISADDSQIAFIRRAINQDGQPETSLLIASSDGAAERTLFAAIYPNQLYCLVWSPDGQSIICSYGNSEASSLDMRLLEIRVADGTKKELSSDRFFRISTMFWLRDKSGLIMCARKNEDQNQLWHASYPNMRISQITQGLSYYLDLSIASSVDKAVASLANRVSDVWIGSSREPRNLKKITQAIDNFCWTPDGRVVYSSTAGGNRDLWIMRPNGTEQRQLTVDTAAVNSTPAVTHDNRYIVFTSNRTGAFQVWRTNFDGSNQIQLTEGAAKNFPAVSRDGRWVYYITSDDRHLRKVSIDGGESAPLTDYPASFPSPSPDGKVIACVGRTERTGKPSILILPVEGGQPLKRFEVTDGVFSGFRVQWTQDGAALIYAARRGGATAIVKQPLDGNPSERIVEFGDDDLFDFGYSIDGQYLAVTRGGWQHDVVLISGLDKY